MINTTYTTDMSRYVLDRLKLYDGKKCNLMIPGGSLLSLLDADELTQYDASGWKIYFSDERCDKNNLNSKDAKVFLDKIKAKEILVDYKVIHDNIKCNCDNNIKNNIKCNIKCNCDNKIKNNIKCNCDNTNKTDTNGPVVYVIDSLNPSGHKCYNILLQTVCIDLCLLGVGENGHTCSIWPNSKEGIVDDNEVIEYDCNTNNIISKNTISKDNTNNTISNNNIISKDIDDKSCKCKTCNNKSDCKECNVCNNSYDLFFVKTTVDDTFPHRMTCTTRFLNQRVSVIYFCLPPKDGKVKKVKSPDSSIMEKLNKVNCNIILYGNK